VNSLQTAEILGGSTYSIMLTACKDAHAIPGCDGLTLDLDALWARLNQLPG
jgi:hypothetical protein